MNWKMPDPQMFNDQSGKTSMSRFLYFVVVVTVMGVWAYLSVKNGHMLMLGAILILAGQKGSQAYAETRQPVIVNRREGEDDITVLGERGDVS